MANHYQAKIDTIVEAVGDMTVEPGGAPLRDVIRSWQRSVDDGGKAQSDPAADAALRKIVLTVLEAAVDLPLDAPKEQLPTPRLAARKWPLAPVPDV